MLTEVCTTMQHSPCHHRGSQGWSTYLAAVDVEVGYVLPGMHNFRDGLKTLPLEYLIDEFLHTCQGATSFPAQSQQRPLNPSSPPPNSPLPPLRNTLQSCSALYSGLNSFSFFTFAQNSLLRSVFTVPGWRPTIAALSLLVMRWKRSAVLTS